MKNYKVLYKEVMLHHFIVPAKSKKEADFEAYCKLHAIEIATHYKVYAALHDDFAEWYHDYMRQNPDLFDHTLIYLDSDYIVDWWEAESYLYDDFDSPYMEITK